MVDFADIINSIASLNDSIKESFTVLRDFLLSVELASLSIMFMLLFLLFLILVFAVISSPAFFYKLWMKQREAINSFMKGNKNKGSWLNK